MLHRHRPGVGSGEHGPEIFGDLGVRCQVSVDVGRAEEAFFSGDIGIVAPYFRGLVSATLECDTGLDVESAGEERLRLKIDTHHPRSGTVVAFEHGIAGGIRLVKLAQREYVAEICEETLDQEVGLHAAECVVDVGGGAHTLRAFLLQSRSQHSHHALTAYDRHMEILVVSLRRTETCGVREAEIEVIAGIEANVGSRRYDGIVYERVLVDTRTD